MSAYIKNFREVGLTDVGAVGGKNASLGEMLSTLSGQGIKVPEGFATTAHCFWTFLDKNKLREPLQQLLSGLDRTNYSNLKDIGASARDLIGRAELPPDIAEAVTAAYRELSGGTLVAVAVRSSATAEDLPQASFAGQHESYLNIQGEKEVLGAVQRCFASLYTNRAIKYREDNGFAHEKVALSVGVQKMVRSDKACSGVGFTLETESGFRDVIHLSGVWGLGENIVQGTVTPDEFLVFKPMLRKGKAALIQKKLGEKEKTMVYARAGGEATTLNEETPADKRREYVLPDEEVLQLARWALVIEDHYGKPMDIEWAKDGESGELYLIQARPETVQSRKSPYEVTEYQMTAKEEPLVSGSAIGAKVATGVARILQSPAESDKLQEGDIVVTDLTSPDWDPVLKRSGGIITNKGGRTSHASIVARELGVPAVVGCGNATEVIQDGEEITVSCCEGKTGKVYRGRLDYKVVTHDMSSIRKPDHTKVMLICGDPDQAFRLSFYPNDGVGLMRLEFIITHFIQVHPMALVKFDGLKDEEVKRRIEELTHHYPEKGAYFVDKLAQGIATIAAAFYPREVIVRMSDFKTNEYANLLGGKEFEPREENPMLGFRGASRYYHPLYREGFGLECAAIQKVRGELGLANVKVMIPFCRTVEEAHKVVDTMSQHGLDREHDPTLQVYVMAEIPSNVLLAEQFAEVFDGFSIGSNDLTQLTLGIDRDSGIISGLFSEQNDAAKIMIATMIEKGTALHHPVGLCGQAPSDVPEFAQFLVDKGITSISFNADALLKGIENIVIAEERKGVTLKAVT